MSEQRRRRQAPKPRQAGAEERPQSPPWWIVWKPDCQLTSNARGAFAVVCQHWNAETREAYPGFKRIALCAGISVSAVRRAMNELVEAGYLTRSRADGRVTHYRIPAAEYTGTCGVPVPVGDRYPTDTPPVPVGHLPVPVGEGTGTCGVPELSYELPQEPSYGTTDACAESETDDNDNGVTPNRAAEAEAILALARGRGTALEEKAAILAKGIRAGFADAKNSRYVLEDLAAKLGIPTPLQAGP